MSEEIERPLNPGLTSFRALAFLAVFAFHTERFGAGYLGVQAFFVLSGFLLTAILVDTKPKAGASAAECRRWFVDFYGRRAIRIFPLYYFYLLATALLILVVGVGTSGLNAVVANRFRDQLPWALTYTYDVFHASSKFQHSPLVSHFWSLAVEEQFYLVWPFAIWLVSENRLRTLLLLVCASGPVMRSLEGMAVHSAIPGLLDRADLFVYVLPFSHVDGFAMGGLGALYGRSRSPLALWAALAGAIGVGTLVARLDGGGVAINELGYAPFMRDGFKYVWGYTVVNAGFAWMLVQVRDRRFAPRLFEHPGLRRLGEISYGLYVYHYPVLWLAGEMLPGWPRWFCDSAALLTTVGISALSYACLERPCLRLKDRWFSHRRVPRPSKT